MTPGKFEIALTEVAGALSAEAQKNQPCRDPKKFESLVCEALVQSSKNLGVKVNPTIHPHAFPDIMVNGFGVEVKHTNHDTWLATGNSVFEGHRDKGVERVYVVYGKMGGWPEVRWSRYEDSVSHVRISHAPRFTLSMDGHLSLFAKLGISYEAFRLLSPQDKMRRIREYSRGRLKPGERLWWLEDKEEPDHGLETNVRLYTNLTQDEKLRYRAEASLVCPQICAPSRIKGKYTDAALYLLTRHGIFAPQVRDLFSAGSAAGISGVSDRRGGDYILRALQNIQTQMRDAALDMDGQIFTEYWGRDYPPNERIKEWLRRADQHAEGRGWIPSKFLFLNSD